ncbi:predicted protein [Nematostella vectensis]|uniref:PH domain-containing protein n=1 Tax=Nematostella vectensis TaxID=45351 RepID=A7RJ73_NEMVE|nr:predicted protein [Nematostella vectensis]|eukprot:XP_001640592.1 predicted protein [Nematostella vectensis]
MADQGSGDGNEGSETVAKQGWLFKRSKLSKKWDKQWCSIKKNQLFYGPTTEELTKAIDLEGCELSECSLDKKQFAFQIKPKGQRRYYFFHAETEQDQQEWMQAICFAKASGSIGDGSQACVVQ